MKEVDRKREKMKALIFLTIILLLSSVECQKNYLVETAEDQFDKEILKLKIGQMKFLIRIRIRIIKKILMVTKT